jgi:beta-glucanase (GH16 family)
MHNSFLVSTALWAALTSAACECGYKTNTGETWQYAVETDFSALTPSQWSSSPDWVVSSIAREAAVTLNYTRSNVVLADNTLQLTCSAYDPSAGIGIQSGEISSARRDILYGSFRATYTLNIQSPGSVSGFFFYANDTQEIDVEVQSKVAVAYPQQVHIGNQPDQGAEVYLPNGGVVTDAHDYRFDWLPGETNFYLDGVPAGGFSDDVPVVNGAVYLNMWGNGGPWAGPMTPSADNVMFVSRIALYFNTSSAAMKRTWDKACTAAGKGKNKGKDSVCVVDGEGLGLI